MLCSNWHYLFQAAPPLGGMGRGLALDGAEGWIVLGIETCKRRLG